MSEGQNYYKLQAYHSAPIAQSHLGMNFTQENKKISIGTSTYKFHQFQFEKPTKQPHFHPLPPTTRIFQVPRESAPPIAPLNGSMHRKSRSVDHPMVMAVGVGSFICFYCGETSTTAQNGRHKCARKVLERHFFKDERREEAEAAESLVSLAGNGSFISHAGNYNPNRVKKRPSLQYQQ
jgi:hypothetical protein